MTAPTGGRRWYEKPGGQEAAEAIRLHARGVMAAVEQGDTAAACAAASIWEDALDISLLSREAHHSIAAAFQDARQSIERTDAEDARAFLQAVLTMLPRG